MSKHSIPLGLCLHLVVAVPVLGLDGVADRGDLEFFESKVRPVLAAHCFKCHSDDVDEPKSGLRLDSRRAMLAGGASGPAVVPGHSDESLLIKVVTHDPEFGLKMPPATTLPESAIADLRHWIERGAPWPPNRPSPQQGGEAALGTPRVHWVLRPLHRPPVPDVQRDSWVRTAIDAFVLAKLESAQIDPAPPAARRTLLRRIFLDLIGIPPTPQEQREFLEDRSPNALARVVDRLLGRPQYGERWGRHWLDVARYAESRGYERDEPKPHAWRYRDYVITAFNKDKPYDRFIVEQLAGDELDDADTESRTAVSFLRLGPFDTIAADAKLARYDQLDDVLGTTTAAFLGQTVRCARCHDHKFEPYSQEEYYQLLAIFDPLDFKNTDAVHVGSPEQLAAYQAAQSEIDARLEPLEDRRDVLLAAILTAAAQAESSSAGEVPLQRRRRLSEELLASLAKPAARRTRQERDRLRRSRQRIDERARPMASDDQRSQLAQLDDQIRRLERRRPAGHYAYVFSEASTTPAPTRLFIRGDVNRPASVVSPAVPSVLGGDSLPPPVPTAHSSGRRLWLARWITGPGHRLAARVMANRIWQYHFGTGLVATSNDFGLQGEPPTHPELLEWLAAELVAGGWSIKGLHRTIVLSNVYQTSAAHRTNEADPAGRLLWHWRTRRLEAEIVRDSILAVSGRLNLEALGPSVFPPLTQKLVGASAGLEWNTSGPAQSSRRSVYVYVKRNIAVPELDVMGAADASASVDRRPVATTALQSLMLLNSRFTNENAVQLARRVAASAGNDPAQQVRCAFELVYCRLPSDAELAASLDFLADQQQFAPVGSDLPLTPLASFCLVLLNTNEFIYVN